MADPREEWLRDEERVRQAWEAWQRLVRQMGRRIVGQQRALELLMTALMAGGHGLLIGVPGLAKTTMVKVLAHCLDLSFRRVQFTPDLMPSDITGTEVLEEDRGTGQRAFRFARGPVFANLLLADEVNRTPPKTQSALLEAMQEHQVTVAGEVHPLPEPFVVFATQNPIEQEGTYPLPEAQLDRFLLVVRVEYPSLEEEVRVVQETTGLSEGTLERVMGSQEVLELQDLVRRMPTPDYVLREAVALVRKTRPQDPTATREVRDYVAWGAGPRAAQHLVLAAKASALLRGEFAVTPDHVRDLAVPVLAHRVVVNFHGAADRVSGLDVVQSLVLRE
ncbi:MAG TPA: AAA family ATPase [Myxococcota bacterium]|nr:AAA family ATPase [Myxococcota bacterium]HQK50021.1 AAA family ATPase [Myxococcota bacterium]